MLPPVERNTPVQLPPPPPPPPPPPVENRAAQDRAISTIETKLDDSGIFNSVSRDEAKESVQALTDLAPIDAARVIDRLSESGKLEKLAKESVENQGGWFGPDGLSRDEQSTFFDTMAQRLDGPHLATLSTAYKAAGSEHQQRMADAVSRQSTPTAALEFVRALAPATTDGGQPSVMGGSYADSDARAVATVTASLRGDYAAQAFAALTPEQRTAVFTASTGLETTTIVSEMPVTLADVHPEGFTQLLDAARSIPDPATRAGVLNSAADTVSSIAAVHGVEPYQVAPLASAIFGAADSASLAAMDPQKAATLAGQAAAGKPEALAETASSLARLDPSAARDATIRTLFLKTPGDAYDDKPELANAMASAYARTQTADPVRQAALTQDYAGMLGTSEGRALLADPKVAPEARAWAMDRVAADPAGMRDLVAGQDKPWESAGILESYARARVDQYAAGRGDTAVRLSGGSDFANFVGAGLNAPMRSDLPTDPNALQTAQGDAARGGYDFYAGVDAIQKPAEGIRTAQSQMGGGEVGVSVLPVQFSSQESGPVDLQLYRVEGGNGQSRFVDNVGRVYDSFDAWKAENDLPPGQMTYPADGHLSPGGSTRLETAATPNVSDTFWEHARDVADVAALVGGVVASGVVLVGSGGTATPLVAGAWAVAIGSAAYTGARAYGDLADRANHGQTLSLTDQDARAAWLSLGGSALTVGGAGVTRLAGLAGEGALAVNGARAAGILNAGANWADAAATVDTAASLQRNWDQLTPAQRAQMGLQIAFWGGMTGVSARTGGGGLGDAFSFRAQMNHAMLQTGAAVRTNPELGTGEASVTAVRDPGGQVTDVRVDYGPGTSREVIDVHTQVARDLIANGGAGGVMRRAFGDETAYRPGTRGEEVSLEVAKHESLLSHYATRLADTNLTQADRAALTRAQTDGQFELRAYNRELNQIRTDRALGDAPAFGSIDVKQSAQHWLDPSGTIPRDDLAQTSFSQLRTDVAQDYPAAQRASLNSDGTLTLADGSRISNFGPRTNSLTRFTTPQADGGYGGALFYDRASNTVIASVNMRTAGNEGSVTRVEVPYTRNSNGEWRADFSQSAPYKTNIDPNMIRDRAEHFKAANQNLRDALANDSTLAARLGLSDAGANAVRLANGTSPEPYTWHHVDGNGAIWLVDSAVHGLFLHTGGFSEWRAGGTVRAR